jgi:FKBP-type peptidyl-prolyl cis-trans isomerase
MREGGERILVIPSSLGYGAQDYGPIPANSTLLFQVRLVSVQKAL